MRSNISGCGKDWTKSAKFGGKGKDYITCERSTSYLETEKNKAQAEAMCVAQRKEGKNCKVIRANVLGCGGKSWSKAGKFGGEGKDYLACAQTTWAVDVHFVISGSKSRPDVESWLREEIAVAQAMYDTDPALKINPHFTYETERGGRKLSSMKFGSGKDFHKYMDDHFDTVAMSETTGYLQVLVVDKLEVDGKPLGGKAHFPHTTLPLGRKHGLAMKIPGKLPIDTGSKCRGKHDALLAHEMGHIFGLLHPWESYVTGGRCNKDFAKGESHQGDTLKNGKINVMDYEQQDKNFCSIPTTLNECQEDRAAQKRREWMTNGGKVRYKKIRGSR